MDKNSINISPEKVSKAPSSRRIKKDNNTNTLDYFRGKLGKKPSIKGEEQNKIGKKEKPTRVEGVKKVEREKPHRLEWLKEYISFVHSNSTSSIIKQSLFNAGITPDICTYTDWVDTYEQKQYNNRTYDPRYSEDVREI